MPEPVVTPEMIEAALDEWIGEDWRLQSSLNVSHYRAEMKAAILAALKAQPSPWRPIADAPRDGIFWAVSRDYEIRRCWRHNPSARTDEILGWVGKRKFPAVAWMPIIPMYSIPHPPGDEP